MHYWVLGWGFSPAQQSERKMAFDLVRKAERIDERTLKLKIQERSIRQGWDVPGDLGKTYDLTVIDRGGRIEIPELSASFVKCKQGEAGSAGMRRW